MYTVVRGELILYLYSNYSIHPIKYFANISMLYTNIYNICQYSKTS